MLLCCFEVFEHELPWQVFFSLIFLWKLRLLSRRLANVMILTSFEIKMMFSPQTSHPVGIIPAFFLAYTGILQIYSALSALNELILIPRGRDPFGQHHDSWWPKGSRAADRGLWGRECEWTGHANDCISWRHAPSVHERDQWTRITTLGRSVTYEPFLFP